MNARSRAGHARWWLRLALASGLTVGAFALHSVPAEAAPSGSRDGPDGPDLAGVPVVLQDLAQRQDASTTAGSRLR